MQKHITQKHNSQKTTSSVYRGTSLRGESSEETVKSSIKSPLRYPGGKSRAVSQILDLLPANIRILCSPFIGGGSVELACASKGITVHGYDAFEPLVNFWQVALSHPSRLANTVAKLHPLSKERFYELQIEYNNILGKIKRAAIFYALNRSSFSGTTLCGGMSPDHPRFTPSSIQRLRMFRAKNFSVDCADFSESIPTHQNHFLYLDPPYANGEKLYGEKGDMHDGFSHETLADIIRAHDRWILSYNDCELIRDLYSGYEFISPKWTYGMNSSKISNEIIIVSKSVTTERTNIS